MHASPSLSSLQPVALLAPKQLRALLLEGGAEVVVEHRMAGKKRMFVHIPDEYERGEMAARHDSCVTVHRKAVEDLTWARETLWNNEWLRRYLYTSDYLTWPALQQLASMVNLAWSAKETDEVADYAAASALRKALKIIRQDVLYTGLHPLREETLTGPLLAFKSEEGNGTTAGDILHVLGSRDDKSMDGNLGTAVWSLELHTPSFTTDDVLKLPLTVRMQDAFVHILQPSLSAATLDNSWSALLAAHRQCVDDNNMGLFCSVPECIAQMSDNVAHVAQLISKAGEQRQRVRMRVGVYGTVIQRNEVFVVSWLSQSHDGTSDESALRDAFEKTVCRSYEVCKATGLIVYCDGAHEIGSLLRMRFLSPLASECEYQQVTETASQARVTHVVVKHNPFVVVHGPRVAGEFPENAGARQELMELLLSREGNASLASRPSPQNRIPNDVSCVAGATSTTFTGEDLRRGVDEAVLRTLSGEPMTRVALATHPNMARFRGVPNFEAVLKDSLKRVAEYQGRKYRPKE
uniref:Uncharacterized protein n=1 Tax=Trypanosoma congolense (strain IL3000) TaxID=1068625 RepID=G0UZ96_TRYCI|nr:conserved hypothetical protein [Trypanosoma congolense IL3000]